MKNSILAFLLFVASVNVFAGITIVSDLDETIKISNSGSAWGSIKYAFKKSHTFTGIPEFFQGTAAYTDKLYVISASPRLLRKKISKSLRSNGIEYDGIILKKWLKFENRKKYKVREIRELMEATSDDFLFFGDDVGDDPEVYAEIMKLYPNRVLGAYIHLVKNRKVPAEVTTHWTAHELAVREYLAGRMTADSVVRVVNAMKGETHKKYVFPNFVTCPTDPSVYSWQRATEFADKVAELNLALLNYCAM